MLYTPGYVSLAIGKWHLGQRDMYLPTSRGFDHYLGIPFSQDIGLSFWLKDGYMPRYPYQPTPLPLLHNKTVLEQPANLYTIADKYAAMAVRFIEASVKAQDPYAPFYAFAPF